MQPKYAFSERIIILYATLWISKFFLSISEPRYSKWGGIIDWSSLDRACWSRAWVSPNWIFDHFWGRECHWLTTASIVAILYWPFSDETKQEDWVLIHHSTSHSYSSAHKSGRVKREQWRAKGNALIRARFSGLLALVFPPVADEKSKGLYTLCDNAFKWKGKNARWHYIYNPNV